MFSTSVCLSLVLAFFVAQSLSVKIDNKEVYELKPTAASEKFWLSVKYDIKQTDTIYDNSGNAVWEVIPGQGSNALVFVKAGSRRHQKALKMIQLETCLKPIKPNYFFDRSTHVWTVVTKYLLPKQDDFTFFWSDRNNPVGTIQYSDKKLASLDKPTLLDKQNHRPAGEYYSVSISEDQGTTIQSLDAVALLFVLLDHLRSSCPQQ